MSVNYVRLSVNINDETAQALRELSEEHGRSFTETVRRAISIAKYLDDEQLAGNRIQIIDERRNEVRELIIT